VHEIFVSDTKLNISPYYLRPGGAFGGSCLPKDVRALNFIAEDIGAQTHIINSIVRSNEAHKLFLFNLATLGLEPGAKVLLNGLAFKQATDDLRESPNLDLARRLIAAGYDLTVYDENLDPSVLMGSNLGYSYSHLPRLGEIISNDVAGQAFDRVIDARGDAAKLAVNCDSVVAIDKL
jgi:GDP-mannose 6-dehydrogenase